MRLRWLACIRGWLAYLCVFSCTSACINSNGGCSECRDSGCLWCGGKCVSDDQAGDTCTQGLAVGFTGSHWVCQEEAHTNDAQEISECRMMLQLTRVDQQFQRQAELLETAGWLALAAPKSKFNRRWCELTHDGKLHCLKSPLSSKTSSAAIDLTKCSTVQKPMKQSKNPNPTVELVCTETSYRLRTKTKSVSVFYWSPW
jgi:hypothetical protein